MKILDLVTRPPLTCSVHATADVAAHAMWNGDCGIVPVVDDAGRLVGIVTDRDLCMAAYISGAPLAAIGVERVMAAGPVTCPADATVDDALALMAEHQVHRLPIVDRAGSLVGIVALSDVVRSRVAGALPADPALAALAAVTRPRGTPAPEPLVELPAEQPGAKATPKAAPKANPKSKPKAKAAKPKTARR